MFDHGHEKAPYGRKRRPSPLPEGNSFAHPKTSGKRIYYRKYWYCKVSAPKPIIVRASFENNFSVILEELQLLSLRARMFIDEASHIISDFKNGKLLKDSH